MDKLITVTAADDVTDDYKKEAKTWTKWDSKSRKKFPYNYQQEERVLILEGAATLTPVEDGADPAGQPFEIKAGEAVTFHVGFKCNWRITKRMKKHYTVIGEPEEDAAAITCDICGVDCVAESYFVKKEELDICPDCHEKDLKKYKGAEHQKEGEKWVKQKPPPKKKQRKKK